ncbi:MucR family transcriptional regulator [Pseudochelatococcus sp. B33]
MSAAETPDLTALTVQLLSAYVENNAVPSSELAQLVRATRAALAGDEKPSIPEKPEPEYTPAVSVRTSLASPDHIISLIDGKPYKTLKRHLATNGLTPAEYRARYKLPDDYPLVAPNYSKQRQETAKLQGLGRRKVQAETEANIETAVAEIADSPAEEPVIAAEVSEAPVGEPAKRGRGKAASSASSRSRRTSKRKQSADEEGAEPVA